MSLGAKGELTRLFRANDDATPVMEEVGDVYGIGDLKLSREVKTKTPYGTGGDVKRQEVVGQLELNSIDITVRYKHDNAPAIAMMTDFKGASQADRDYELRLADDNQSLIALGCQVSDVSQSTPDGDYIERTFTLVINSFDDTGVWV